MNPSSRNALTFAGSRSIRKCPGRLPRRISDHCQPPAANPGQNSAQARFLLMINDKITIDSPCHAAYKGSEFHRSLSFPAG
jgi:hypothetical protein